jgi:hypothetical protein
VSERRSAKARVYGVLPGVARRAVLARFLRDQSVRCARGGSAFYGRLLERAADDVRSGGACWTALRDVELETALPLRFMGGIHRLVLDGAAPPLAAHYPSTGGDGDAEAAWPAFAETAAANAGFIASFVEHPVQTNEVARCRALLGGFLEVADTTGLPLRLLEIGASAGLNLRWDRYRYEARGASWGSPSSRVVLRDGFLNEPPYRPVDVTVASRAGCDLFPVDASLPEGRATLLAYTWADQSERLALLREALDIARDVPVELDEADGVSWLERRLATEEEGAATVVFHSYVLQLIGPEGRGRLTELLEEAGARATVGRPVAWLQYEYLGGKGTVRLRTWPGRRDVVLAHASAHGQNIEWAPTPGQHG